jgi:hypothetical protein
MSSRVLTYAICDVQVFLLLQVLLLLLSSLGRAGHGEMI